MKDEKFVPRSIEMDIPAPDLIKNCKMILQWEEEKGEQDGRESEEFSKFFELAFGNNIKHMILSIMTTNKLVHSETIRHYKLYWEFIGMISLLAPVVIEVYEKDEKEFVTAFLELLVQNYANVVNIIFEEANMEMRVRKGNYSSLLDGLKKKINEN